MSNTKISELNQTTGLPSGFFIPVIQSSGTTNTSYKISSDNLKIACTGPEGPEGPTGPAGIASYDAVVDAGGTRDYTTVGAAIAAGKVNIFVNNGSYTETYWDCTSKNISITGQSKAGVLVAFSDATAHSNSYINASSGTGLRISNIGFTITFNDVNYMFAYTSTSFVGIDFKFDNCGFILAQGANPTLGATRKLVSGTYIDMNYSNTIVDLPRSFNNGFFNSTFYTAYDKGASDYAIILAEPGFGYFQGCRFTTDTTAGTINLNGVTILNRCFLDVYRYSGGGLSLIDTTISLKAGGSHANNSAGPGTTIEFYTLNNSYIVYNTSVTTSTTITIDYACNNSQLIILAQNVILGGGSLRSNNTGNYIATTGTITTNYVSMTGNMLIAATVITNNSQNCSFTGNVVQGAFTAGDSSYQSITGNTISGVATIGTGPSSGQGNCFSGNHVTGATSIGWRYCTVSANYFSSTITMTANCMESVFTGNACGTITTTASGVNNVITGNQNGAITDGAAGTVKSGNRNN